VTPDLERSLHFLKLNGLCEKQSIATVLVSYRGLYRHTKTCLDVMQHEYIN